MKKVYISPTFRIENDPFADLPIFKVVPASSLKLYYIFYLTRVGTSVSSENSSLPSILSNYKRIWWTYKSPCTMLYLLICCLLIHAIFHLNILPTQKLSFFFRLCLFWCLFIIILGTIIVLKSINWYNFIYSVDSTNGQKSSYFYVIDKSYSLLEFSSYSNITYTSLEIKRRASLG